MQIVVIVLLALVALLLLGLVILFGRSSVRARVAEERHEATKRELEASFSTGLNTLSNSVSGVTSLVHDQLSLISTQMQSSTGQINDRMENAARMVSGVQRSLGALGTTTERLVELGKSIQGVEEILKSPKLRGGLGEFLLADLLAQSLPSAHYALQHNFSNGTRVDALVKLDGGSVPIDSKFPLEDFRRILSATSDEETRTARRAFVAGVKRHIDAVADMYILPAEGTLNFALMYIPAENIYYESIVRDLGGDTGSTASPPPSGVSLSEYAFARRVIPVSPNTLYLYLQSVLMGLRGAEVEGRATEILAHLDSLGNDFDAIATDFSVLGRHLGNATAKYDDIGGKVERYSYALTRLGSADGPAPFDKAAEASSCGTIPETSKETPDPAVAFESTGESAGKEPV